MNHSLSVGLQETHFYSGALGDALDLYFNDRFI